MRRLVDINEQRINLYLLLKQNGRYNSCKLLNNFLFLPVSKYDLDKTKSFDEAGF